MADHFPPGSMVRTVGLEPALMLGAGRALLLQLAHPAVAQGVQDHSDFKRNPFKRLQGTMEAVYGVVFGSEELAHGIGRRIHRMHEYVRGPGYEANDPANLLWVHATLLDTALRCYGELVAPIPDDDAEAYYQEMTRVAEVFGVPRDAQPATLADFRTYFDDAVAGIEVTDVGRELSAFILDPSLPLGLHVPTRPLLRLQRLFTLATLPPPIRVQLGVRWDDADEARYRRARGVVRSAFRTTPTPIRTAPTRLARRHLVHRATKHVATSRSPHPHEHHAPAPTP